MRLRSEYGRKQPVITSKLVWQRVNEGKHPNPGQSYDDWISCSSAEVNARVSRLNSSSCPTEASPAMWSPRRHAAGVFFKGAMYIFGGRAREFVSLAENKRVGGIIGPIVGEIDFNNNPGQKFTTQRESVVLKNDVWRSYDGVDWELLQVGCKAPQRELVAQGNPAEGRRGRVTEKCTSDDDCYGAERCDAVLKTCICSIWSPREQHSVVVHGDTLYLSGGYSSALYSLQSNCGAFACGDTDASSYRRYMGDLWRSFDGIQWEMLYLEAFPGRGGHSFLSLDTPSFLPQARTPEGVRTQQLWVIGGRGGSNTVGSPDLVYFNDIWVADLYTNGSRGQGQRVNQTLSPFYRLHRPEYNMKQVSVSCVNIIFIICMFLSLFSSVSCLCLLCFLCLSQYYVFSMLSPSV